MNDEKQEEIQIYSLEEFWNMAQEKQQKKTQTNGRGVGGWLVSWGFILFVFERYCGFNGGIMWAFRIVGLICLLFGLACLGMSFEGRKE